jgi:hypothetical protein
VAAAAEAEAARTVGCAAEALVIEAEAEAAADAGGRTAGETIAELGVCAGASSGEGRVTESGGRGAGAEVEAVTTLELVLVLTALSFLAFPLPPVPLPVVGLAMLNGNALAAGSAAACDQVNLAVTALAHAATHPRPMKFPQRLSRWTDVLDASRGAKHAAPALLRWQWSRARLRRPVVACGRAWTCCWAWRSAGRRREGGGGRRGREEAVAAGVLTYPS